MKVLSKAFLDQSHMCARLFMKALNDLSVGKLLLSRRGK
jgi:hypothetical protein